jgi:fructose/tagatose bisphosphate aldolase
MPNAAVVFHSIEHLNAALTAAHESGVALTLLTAPGAAAYLGAGWFREAVAAALAAHPDVRATMLLDCGDRPGDVLAAFRAGVQGVIFTGRSDVADKLAALAQAHGTVFWRTRPAAHDLLDAADPLESCRRWLSRR